jgi:RNA polymerase I-specific transcription initiation factor RRN3
MISCGHDLIYFEQVCSPNVVMQFARVAHATDFIYCYTILESNKRSEDRRVIPSVASAQTRPPSTGIRLMIGSGSIDAELNTFFPFDPYRLPKSNVYIQCVYREWSTVAIDEEDDEEEEFGDGERSDISRQWKIPQSSNYGSEEVLGESLGKMSISPIWPPVSSAHHA